MAALDARTGAVRWRQKRPGELTSWSTAAGSRARGPGAGDRRRGRPHTELRRPQRRGSLERLRPRHERDPHADLRCGDPLPRERQARQPEDAGRRPPRRPGRPRRRGRRAVDPDRDTPYVSTPLLYRGQIYFFRHTSSFLTSVDAATGKTHFTERTDLGNVFASPVAAAGRIYLRRPRRQGAGARARAPAQGPRRATSSTTASTPAR